MKEPTANEVREFWEWSGFWEMSWPNHPRPTGSWWYGTEKTELPPIDLNNLFKYAVPKFANYQLCIGIEPGKPVFGQHLAEVWSLTHGYGKAYNVDPALALFWAIWEIKEAK